MCYDRQLYPTLRRCNWARCNWIRRRYAADTPNLAKGTVPTRAKTQWTKWTRASEDSRSLFAVHLLSVYAPSSLLCTYLPARPSYPRSSSSSSCSPLSSPAVPCVCTTLGISAEIRDKWEERAWMEGWVNSAGVRAKNFAVGSIIVSLLPMKLRKVFTFRSSRKYVNY